MHTDVYRFVRLMGIAVFATLSAGCATSGHRACPAHTNTGAPGVQAQAEPVNTADEAAKDAKDEEKQVEEEAMDARQHAKLERELAIAHRGIEKARIAQAHAEIEHVVNLAKAERELGLEKERLHIFTERTVPNRIEKARLDLTRAEDRFKEADEELKQLEMMYAEEDFADGTKEIVLERGRRRLERTRRDLELRHESFATLTEKTIPLEVAEHELKVEEKAQALDKARRAAEASQLDKHIGVMKAEAEVARLEAEIGALDEKMEKRRAEREK